mmetsp:Transcript_18637/g.43572  ORF Transcript_18637/g.43572 Transcript_18637/m.43572 type:complete len:350 (+) Transcript_18637:37-1086(+)
MGDAASTQSEQKCEVEWNEASSSTQPWSYPREIPSSGEEGIRSMGSRGSSSSRGRQLTTQDMSRAFRNSFRRAAGEALDDWPEAPEGVETDSFASMPYDEALQERVYLGLQPAPAFHSDDELAEAENDQGRGRQVGVGRKGANCLSNGSGAAVGKKAEVLKPATKSKSLRHDPVPKAAQRAAAAWKDFQVPIRHTFVHFDNPEKLALFDRLAGRASPGQANRQETGQLVHSSSSPALMRCGADDETPLHNLEQDQLSSSSAPACVKARVEKPRPKTEAELRHERGECRPCAYFFYKKDGCRLGNNCEFCHVCPRGEGKKKKAKAKAKHRPRHRPALGRNSAQGGGNASE